MTETVESIDDGDAIRSEILAIEQVLQIDAPQLDELTERLADLDEVLSSTRVRALQAEADHESAYRDVERRQLVAVAAAFPTADETSQYLLRRLFTDGECLACGNLATQASEEVRNRVSDGQCVLCGTELAGEETETPSATRRGIKKAEKLLTRAVAANNAAQLERRDVEASFEELLGTVEALAAAIGQRRARLVGLAKQLPPDEADLHRQREELLALRVLVESQKSDLKEMRRVFAEDVSSALRSISRRKSGIKAKFDEFASGFLFEECALVWAPHRATVGESGAQIEFPAFELEMTGASFVGPVRRTGPEQVSESQREFIDLAFRMALMSEAAKQPGGTLVIDAPESSLDAVFVSRAAEVLARFADSTSRNRLVITSNLVDGDLIPTLLRRSGVTSQESSRVVDLLSLAAPTAATSALAAEYDEAMTDVFKRATV